MLIGIVTYLVLAGTASSFAYWTANGSLSGTASTASVGVTLSGTAALTTTYTSTSTGPWIAQLTVGAASSNPGAVNLAFTSTVTPSTANSALASAIRLVFWMPTSGSCGSMPAGAGTLAAPPALPAAAASLAAGGSATICAGTQFTGTYSSFAGQNVTVSSTLTGTLAGTSWTGSANGAFTQTLSAAAPTFQCSTNGGNVTVSWANTAAANTGTTYRSRINGTVATGLAGVDYYYHEYSNQGITGTGLPNVAGVYPWTIEETTNGVTTTAYTGQVEVYFFTAWNAWSIRCV